MDIVTYVLAKNSANSAIATAIAAVNAQIAQNTTDIADLKADQYKAYVTDTASGSIASFTDGADNVPVKDLTVAVEPVQDLHGYDNPWPAGGGVNLLDPAKCSVIGPGGAYGLTVTHDQATAIWTISGTPTLQNATLSFNFCNYSDFSLSGKGYQVQAFPISGTPIKSLYGFRNEAENRIAIIIDTVANPTVNMTFKVSVAATAQTAWSPYSNICPISGWSEVTVEQRGKNLFNGTFLQGYWAYADGAWINSPNWITTEKIPCKASTSYTVSADAKATRWQGFVWYDANGDYISTDNLNSNVNIGLTKTSPSNAAYLIFNIAGYPTSIDPISPSDVTHFQLEEGQTATSYAPYNPSSRSISLGQTVYGGTLDVTTGKLTVDRAIMDLGTKKWYPSTGAGRTRFRASITDIERISSPNVAAPMLCSEYKTETANNTYSGRQGISLQQNAADVYVYDAQKESMSAADFKAAMSGVQLVYKLATPIVYDLTPTEVATLLAQNNIWADCGDSTVNYRADTKLYIDKKIAALAAAMN